MARLQSVVPFIGILFLFQRTTAQRQRYHLINEPLSWYEAQNFCRVKYADLATVNHMEDKNELVQTLGSRVAYSWIGLHKGNAVRYVWSDGKGPASFTKWFAGEPNNDGGKELCGEIREDGEWNDANCGSNKGFACYYYQQDGTRKYVFYSEGKDWVSSQELCRHHHVDLAFINNEMDNWEIAKVAGEWNKILWIGLFYDTWMWSDGRETSFRYWLSGSASRGDCVSVAVSQQGRWIEAQCDQKTMFVCQGDLKMKRTVIRLMVRSDVDLTDSTVSDAFLKKLKAHLKQQQVTDFNLSWQKDNNGLVFQRQ